MPKQPDPSSTAALPPKRLADLLAQTPTAAQALRAAPDRASMQAALAPFSLMTPPEELAFATALGAQRGDLGHAAADVAEALADLSPDRAAAKEARRSVIRLRTAGFRTTITVPRPSAGLPAPHTDARPEFVAAWASRTRERSEVQLAALWSRPGSSGEVDPFVMALNFWEGRIDDARHLEPMTQRKFERDVLTAIREQGHFTWVSLTEAQLRALIEAALDQQAWRKEPARPDWQELADVVLRRVQRDDIIPDDDADLALIDPESDAEETIVNFWGSWCFGDFALLYDLLSPRGAIREKESRADFIALRRQWYDEAHTARFQLGAINEQSAEQSSGLWLPSTAQATQNRPNYTIFWSVELQESPIAGQMPEMPLATIMNPDSNRHWYWQTITLERNPSHNFWQIARMRDDALGAQAQPVAELAARSDALWEEADKLAAAQETREDIAREMALKVISLAQESQSRGEAALMRLPADRELHVKLHDHAAQLALWDRAAAITHRMLARFPDKARYQRDLASLDFRRAQTYAETGDEASYLRWLDFATIAARAANDLDRSAESLVILAELVMARGEFDEAEQLLRDSLGMQESTGAWADLGDLLMRQQKPREAVDAFERAQKLEPQSPQIRWRLGRALELADRLAEARLVYEDALASDANDAMAHALLGNVLIEQQDFDAAQTHLERALQLGLMSAQLLTQLGYLAAQRHAYDEARAYLNQAAQIDPSIAADVKHLTAQLNAEEQQGKKKHP